MISSLSPAVAAYPPGKFWYASVHSQKWYLKLPIHAETCWSLRWQRPFVEVLLSYFLLGCYMRSNVGLPPRFKKPCSLHEIGSFWPIPYNRSGCSLCDGKIDLTTVDAFSWSIPRTNVACKSSISVHSMLRNSHMLRLTFGTCRNNAILFKCYSRKWMCINLFCLDHRC